jgi:hypothetical protein
MKPIRKAFNPALYAAYDEKAKDALVAHLESTGHTDINTTEDYYVDVVSHKHGLTYLNEAEVKVGWTEEWPKHWLEIRIPERKQRLLDKYDAGSGVLNFYIFRKDLKQAWRIKDTLLTKDSLRIAKGRNIQQGELFFHIPYEEAELVTL